MAGLQQQWRSLLLAAVEVAAERVLGYTTEFSGTSVYGGHVAGGAVVPDAARFVRARVDLSGIVATKFKVAVRISHGCII